jgi:hypothetical protein
MIAEANRVQAPAAAGPAIFNNFRQACPLVTDKPSQEDIPSEHDFTNASEIAMWIVRMVRKVFKIRRNEE